MTARFLLLVLMGLMMSGCIIRVESPPMADDDIDRSSVGPVPINTTGLDEYDKHKLFASRYIEEGDFPMALEELESAEALRTDEPALFELKAIAYDADRQSQKAYDNFIKAAHMYMADGNKDKTVQMLGWLRTFQIHKDDSEYALIEKRAVLMK